MKPKRSKSTGRFLKGTGLGRSKRKHGGRKRRSLGSACQFGVNKNTGKCLKHPRVRRR